MDNDHRNQHNNQVGNALFLAGMAGLFGTRNPRLRAVGITIGILWLGLSIWGLCYVLRLKQPPSDIDLDGTPPTHASAPR